MCLYSRNYYIVSINYILLKSENSELRFSKLEIFFLSKETWVIFIEKIRTNEKKRKTIHKVCLENFLNFYLFYFFYLFLNNFKIKTRLINIIVFFEFFFHLNY